VSFPSLVNSTFVKRNPVPKTQINQSISRYSDLSIDSSIYPPTNSPSFPCRPRPQRSPQPSFLVSLSSQSSVLYMISTTSYTSISYHMVPHFFSIPYTVPKRSSITLSQPGKNTFPKKLWPRSNSHTRDFSDHNFLVGPTRINRTRNNKTNGSFWRTICKSDLTFSDFFPLEQQCKLSYWSRSYLSSYTITPYDSSWLHPSLRSQLCSFHWSIALRLPQYIIKNYNFTSHNITSQIRSVQTLHLQSKKDNFL
jgi:hypothetical protein